MRRGKHQLTRRALLQGVAVGGAALTAGVPAKTKATPTVSEHSDITVILDNVGTSAWDVTEVQGADGVAQKTNNPELTLTTGTRYTFRNQGWDAHPLAFRESGDGGGYGDSGMTLLTQGDDGTLEDDTSINWKEDGSSVSFTLTDKLADSLDQYRCTVHSGSMEGTIITQRQPEYNDPNGRVFFETVGGETVETTDSVSVDSGRNITLAMGSEEFVIEPASEGVRPGHGHFHILVDQSPVSAGDVIPNNPTVGYYHYGGGQTTAELDFEPGKYTIYLQAGDANHTAYDLTDRIQLTVGPGDVTGDGAPATDPDGDGRFEDVTGDGETDILDVVSLFDSRESDTVQNNPNRFDFNDDDETNVLDVVALFNKI